VDAHDALVPPCHVLVAAGAAETPMTRATSAKTTTLDTFFIVSPLRLNL
jgi:hypothetical protein